jgi:hypothetical protein
MGNHFTKGYVMTQMPPMQAPQGGLQPHRGTMILIFGILGLVCCVVFGIIAWVMGKGDLEKIRTGQMDPAGEGTTKAGMVCGIISCCLAIVGLVIWIIGMVAGFAFLPMHA